MRGRLRVLAGLVALATASGATAAVADEPAPGRLTGDDPAHAAGQDGSADPAAPTPVPLPDLGITHRLADGGMNLFRMPLSELEEGYGEPQLVRRLPASQGWRYDRSVVLAGDFGDITAGDDGTADHVIWQVLADYSVRVWGVGGGSNTTPQLWHTLPRADHWLGNWTRPVAGDVNGDTWTDLVVRQKRYSGNDQLWVFLSDGERLGAPQWWGDSARFDHSRDVLADVDGDYNRDFVMTQQGFEHPGLNMYATVVDPTGTDFVEPGGEWMFHGPSGAGWSFPMSRQVAGDVTGDGLDDIVTIHGTRSHPGLLIWVHENCTDGTTVCFEDPVRWQTLSSNGWNFARSRQYLADTDGDYVLDLVSVHQGGNGGFLVWRHVSSGTGFAAPERIVDLRTGGWRWASAREGVADTWGAFE